MLPPKCFTCNKLFADIELHLEAEYKRIENDPQLNEDEKLKQKEKLLDYLNMNRYCCRMRLISYVDLVQVIN